jgi:molybdenum cofactor guanylyltransferase
VALGAILAGGDSERMGADKATVELAGRPMVEWVAQAIASVCDDLVVVGREGRIGGLPCLPDTQSNVRGPLAGLATALGLGKRLLLVAVDQPFLDSGTLRRLLDLADHGAVVPIDGARQVTCAVYPASWRSEAIEEIARGGSIQSLLDRLLHRRVEEPEWRAWGEDGRSWFGVDTPEDVAEGLARYGTPR